MELVTGEDAPAPSELLKRAEEIHPLAVELIEPQLGMTVAPTMISASKTRNVIPSLVEVTVDCRLLPGQTQDEAEQVIRDVLGEDDYELEWLEAHGGTRSPMDTPLWDAIESWVADVEPGGASAPICLAGFTDSHWPRSAFGTVAYGFFPMRYMDPQLATRLVHSADERVRMDDLELGTAFLRYAARVIGAIRL
jgi:acetylornithine deacetylase/succinyl-diaminopimelate desuccinylase-like protein